jgi:hypothetical protein
MNLPDEFTCKDGTRWIDWNKLSLDEMVEYLKQKHQFSSTGESKCIFELIQFYEDRKSKK